MSLRRHQSGVTPVMLPLLLTLLLLLQLTLLLLLLQTLLLLLLTLLLLLLTLQLLLQLLNNNRLDYYQKKRTFGSLFFAFKSMIILKSVN